MSDQTNEDATFCVVAGTTHAASAADHSAAGPGTVRNLTIVSDVICPWCYVGKRHLHQALESTGLASRLNISWQPYELNPSMPANGMDRRAYRSRKFGSWERSKALDAQIAAVGLRAGIVFRHDLMMRTPNSFQAHRLIWLAAKEGVQDAVVEALFRAYFTEGRDVGELPVLVAIGTQAGIEKERVITFLDGTAGIEEVRRAEQIALQAEISGVPTFALDGEPLFSGALAPDVMAARLSNALAAR